MDSGPALRHNPLCEGVVDACGTHSMDPQSVGHKHLKSLRRRGCNEEPFTIQRIHT